MFQYFITASSWYWWMCTWWVHNMKNHVLMILCDFTVVLSTFPVSHIWQLKLTFSKGLWQWMIHYTAIMLGIWETKLQKGENWTMWSFIIYTIHQILFRLEDRGLVPGRDGDLFSSQSPGRLWGPPSLLPNGYWGSFPGSKVAGVWSWPLTSIKCQG